LAKGGHLPDDDRDAVPHVHDLLIRASGVSEYRMRRIDTRHNHGTGCTLATAVAAGLGHGLTMEDAVDRAEAFVAGALHHAPGFGKGHGPMGHAMGTTPFYHQLASVNREGFDAVALAARWGDNV
jgi:hydroxymethylpyrimidine/phosphomethylpyrimidine kinase